MAADALTFRIGADTDEFSRKMGEAERRVKQTADSGGFLADKFSKANIAMAAATVAAGAFAAAMAGAVAAIEKFGTIQDISERTGLSPEFLQKISAAAKNSGSSLDEVGKAVNKFAKELYGASEGSRFSDSLDRIGLSVESLRAMSPEEMFQAIAAALNGVENDSERAALAQELFGRSGANLTGVITGLGNALNKTGVLTADQVEAIDDVGDAWGHLQDEAVTAMGAVVAEVAPQIIAMVNELRKWAAALQSVAVFWGELRNGASFDDAFAASEAFRQQREYEIDNPEEEPKKTDFDTGGGGGDNGGGGGGGAAAPKAATSSDLGKTPEEKALEKYDADPAFRNPDGTFRNPGTRRQMQRQADASRRRADNRNNRLGGPASISRGSGAAQSEADDRNMLFSESSPGSLSAGNLASMRFPESQEDIDAAQAFGETANMSAGAVADVHEKLREAEERARREKAIQDAMNAAGKSPEERAEESRGRGTVGGDSNSLLSEIKSLLSEVRSTVAKIEPKLPQRVLA